MLYAHRYVCIYADIQMCMYANMSVHMYACVYVYVLILYSHITVHLFDMSLNKYGCHIADMTNTAITLHEHIGTTFLHIC